MRKVKYWGAASVIGLFIGILFWWAVSEMKDRKDPLNQSDAFVYSDKGILYWYELTSHNGKVRGKLYQRKVIEEIGQPPYMLEKDYPIIGKEIEKSYEFKVKSDGKIKLFNARFSKGNFLVQQRGETADRVYRAVDKEKLDKYIKAIKKDLEVALYYSEQKEMERIDQFFSEVRSPYGFLYTAENGSYLLFLKVDEALREGELSCTLLMMENNPYKETKYELNGITDGLMLKLYTTVDGKETILKGHFHGDATRFDLSFWKPNQELFFHAVTEEEFKRSYEAFKTKAQK